MERRGFLRLFGMALAGAVIVPTLPLNDVPLPEAAPVQKVPTIDIRLHSVEVRSTTRKLRCTWTPEAAADLRTTYGINSKEEEELVALMSQHLEDELYFA